MHCCHGLLSPWATKCTLLSSLAPLGLSIALSFSSPSMAIPFPAGAGAPVVAAPTTPFSQSRDLKLGLDDGKIRPCPSVNPSCVSTNPKSSSFAFPLVIPSGSSENSIQGLIFPPRTGSDGCNRGNPEKCEVSDCRGLLSALKDGLMRTHKNVKFQTAEKIPYGQALKDAIVRTQKNVKFQIAEETPYGQYLQAEVDAGFGRDVMEFLVKGDVVAYRSMATKVTYIYPFTTAFGDSKGEEERMERIVEQLGWYSPKFDTMD